ncbi:MAG: SDR family oxidoreductase [Parvularculaceae bacterium]|nr:SDR family oxidoreductase [Parvularculaceae bacterium]
MKSVLVTGGAKRVGAAIARRLARDGWKVVIHHRQSQEAAEALAKSIGGLTLGADLTDAAAAEALPARAAALLGAPLTAVVNNASVFEYNTAKSFTTSEFDRDMAVNLRAPVLIARAFAKTAAPGADAAVVNFIDQKVWNLNADFFSYTISKLALEGATRLLARALAPSVRVNGVAPGLTLPNQWQSDDEFAAVAAKHNILKRPIAIDSLAGAVAFLLDNNAITGQTIIADNGEHLVPTERDIGYAPEEAPQ